MVPLQVLFAFGIAVMLTRAKRGVGFFRTVFYLPALIPPVAATLGFVYLLNPATGPVNTLLAEHRDRGPALVQRPGAGRSRRSSCSRLWGIGNIDDHLPRRSSRRAAAPLRVGRARRRRAVPAPPLGDAAADQPRDPLRGRARRDPGRSSTSRRRTSQRASPAGQASQAGTQSTLELGYPEGSTLFYPVLLYYHGFRFFNMGYAVGDGDAAARRRVRRHAPDPAQLASLGALPGGGAMSARGRSGHRGRARSSGGTRRRRCAAAGCSSRSPTTACSSRRRSSSSLPVVFIFLTSLMTNEQALSPKLWPDPFQWGNYSEVFSSAPLWRWALNSFIYSEPRDARPAALEHPGRLCLRPAALARARGRVPASCSSR